MRESLKITIKMATVISHGKLNMNKEEFASTVASGSMENNTEWAYTLTLTEIKNLAYGNSEKT